jgi:hypothetical protein
VHAQKICLLKVTNQKNCAKLENERLALYNLSYKQLVPFGFPSVLGISGNPCDVKELLIEELGPSL